MTNRNDCAKGLRRRFKLTCGKTRKKRGREESGAFSPLDELHPAPCGSRQPSIETTPADWHVLACQARLETTGDRLQESGSDGRVLASGREVIESWHATESANTLPRREFYQKFDGQWQREIFQGRSSDSRSCRKEKDMRTVRRTRDIQALELVSAKHKRCDKFVDFDREL